jgi:hypothetical protein
LIALFRDCFGLNLELPNWNNPYEEMTDGSLNDGEHIMYENNQKNLIRIEDQNGTILEPQNPSLICEVQNLSRGETPDSNQHGYSKDSSQGPTQGNQGGLMSRKP